MKTIIVAFLVLAGTAHAQTTYVLGWGDVKCFNPKALGGCVNPTATCPQGVQHSQVIYLGSGGMASCKAYQAVVEAECPPRSNWGCFVE